MNAKLMTSDFDDRDSKYLSKNRTSDGYFLIENNHEMAITKSLHYAESVSYTHLTLPTIA